MTRAQAHEQLARSLGDPVTITGSPSVLRDGVRYSIKMRDAYLYRAMLDTQNEFLKQTASLPVEQRSLVLQSLFPNFRRRYSGSYTLTTPTVITVDLPTIAVFVYSAYLWNDADGNVRPEVFTRGDHHDIMKWQSNLHGVRMDPRYVCHYKGDQTVSQVSLHFSFDEQAYITTGRPDITIDYLPLPTDPNTQSTDSLLTFEEQYMKTVLGRAAAYGRADNEDLQDMNTFVQLTTQ